MAKPKKSSTKKVAATKNEDTVIRISASDKKDKKPTAKPISKKKAIVDSTYDASEKKRGVLRSFFGYFKGAWQELKLVRWPTRKATWGLTFAVLLFSAFFVVFILLLDAGFKYLFELLYKQ